MSAEKKTIKIFIAYSQKDRTELDALRTHAAPLLRKGNVTIWFDGEIIPGEAWDAAIKSNLHAADIILMLLSSHSLASDYFYEQEVKDALKRHKAGTARVVPVVLSACLWQETPLADLQGLPKGMKPINSWPNREDAWNEVLMGVSSMIRELENAGKEMAREQEKIEKHPIAPALKPTTKEEHAWEFTTDTDTRTSYEKFLTRFPDGFYAATARERLDYFDADDTAWEFATDNGSEMAIKKYLEKYPNGLHVLDAQQKIAGFEEERQEAARKRREQEAAERRRIDPFYDLMIPIKGGTFDMGDTFGDGINREQPVHKVTLSDYWLCKYPVTQGLWKAIMGKNNNPSSFKGDDTLPIETVSWDDAQEFIQALNKKTGGQYRLPTEAEWEYAAREGGKKIRFGNGKDIANPSEMNFYAKEDHKQPYSIVGEYQAKTTPVNQFKPNALGLYDMAGNVWDWCTDWFAEDYYQQCAAQGMVSNPQGPDTGTYRVLRGGSWSGDPQYCRAAWRARSAPPFRARVVGFRVASSLPFDGGSASPVL
ncbi:MAG: SUMF1/EgtB/PvdO family nonheme iron enzyme [Saprospiraceae bacterium]|nr:SUMF1/EgtB/PvdO family nonheme iron enzyme [Saprospiraceae bacterium]